MKRLLEIKLLDLLIEIVDDWQPADAGRSPGPVGVPMLTSSIASEQMGGVGPGFPLQQQVIRALRMLSELASAGLVQASEHQRGAGVRRSRRPPKALPVLASFFDDLDHAVDDHLDLFRGRLALEAHFVVPRCRLPAP